MNPRADLLIAAVDRGASPSALRSEFLENADALLGEIATIASGVPSTPAEDLNNQVRAVRNLVAGLEFGRTYPAKYPMRYDTPIVGSGVLEDAAGKLLTRAADFLANGPSTQLVAEFDNLPGSDLNRSARNARSFARAAALRHPTKSMRPFLSVARSVAGAVYALLVWSGADVTLGMNLAELFAEELGDLDWVDRSIRVGTGNDNLYMFSRSDGAGVVVKQAVRDKVGLPHHGWVPITISEGFSEKSAGQSALAAVEGIDGPARVRFGDGSEITLSIKRVDGSSQPGSEPSEPAPVKQPDNLSVTIAPLTMVSFLDDADAFDDAFSEAEELMSELTRLAHNENTPPEVAARSTQHATDGRALMLGPDDQPRELPPAPRTVYGWIVDALELLQTDNPPTGSAKQLFDAVTGTPHNEPRGLQEGLEQVARRPYRQVARERIRDGSLDGLEELVRRVVAHPARSAVGVTTLALTIFDTVQGWPWLGAGVRALIRLVQAAV